jgi:D-alanyl-D-alanine carboxypeptidase
MTVEHRLGLGSMTKSYVAALLLLLQEDGLVELDDPLSSFVSTSDVPDADVITIRQLLSHQSGIAEFQDNATFVEEVTADLGRVWSPMELVQYAIELGPTSPPGEGWHYSNTNYILAGLVAEQASGLALGEALRSRVLDPAGLEHTYFDGEETVSGPLARSYYMGMDLTGYPDPSWAWAAGSMVATVGDLLRWTEGLFRGPLLDEGSKAQLREWVETGGTPLEYYGLGVFLCELEAGTVVGHNGQIAGYTGAMGDRFRTDELAVVLFNTSEGPDPLLGVDAALMALDGG